MSAGGADLGGTSLALCDTCYGANSASVRSPRTAASATTFALNAAECVRRVLFVIVWFPL